MSQTKAQLIDPVDGTIVNADINASAAIAGTKISPDFGSQNVATTGNLTVDTNTLFVNASNNRVGIGTASPGVGVDIRNGSVQVVNGTDNFITLTSTGSIELCRVGGSFIDFSTDGTEDHDCRIKQESDGLAFTTGGNGSATEKLRILSDGKIGIGTSSPTTTVQIQESSSTAYANATTSNHATVYIVNQAQGSSGNILLQCASTGSNITGQATINAINSGASTTNTSLTFGVRSAADGNAVPERMRIQHDGKVGIKTISPTKELDVVGEIKATGSVFTAGINGGQVGGNRNLIINGAMDIWQRGTSTSTSGDYQADRFWMSNAASYSRDTTVPSDNFVYSAKLTYGSSDMAFGQPIELKGNGEASPFTPGGKCTLSFYAKTETGSEAAAVIINFRGSKFDSTNQVAFTAASGNANDLNFTATSSWQRFTFTFTVPTPHSSNALAGLEIYGLSRTMFITGVQLELGEIATTFEFRELATELVLCQRYAYVVDARGSIDNFAPIGIGRFYNGTDAQIFIPLPTSMRLPPTFDSNHTTSSNTFFLNNNGLFSGAACTQITMNERSFSAVTIIAQSIGNISGQTAGTATTLYANDANDARLMLIAEF